MAPRIALVGIKGAIYQPPEGRYVVMAIIDLQAEVSGQDSLSRHAAAARSE